MLNFKIENYTKTGQVIIQDITGFGAGKILKQDAENTSTSAALPLGEYYINEIDYYLLISRYERDGINPKSLTHKSFTDDALKTYEEIVGKWQVDIGDGVFKISLLIIPKKEFATKPKYNTYVYSDRGKVFYVDTDQQVSLVKLFQMPEDKVVKRTDIDEMNLIGYEACLADLLLQKAKLNCNNCDERKKILSNLIDSFYTLLTAANITFNNKDILTTAKLLDTLDSCECNKVSTSSCCK